MRLLAPTTFTDSYLDALHGLEVGSLYGAVTTNTPSLQTRKWLPDVNEEQLEVHVRHARKRGFGFIYTVNSRSWEFTADGQSWLAQRFEWLVENGVEGVVTANPYVMELITKRFPALQVHVSTLADVDNLDNAGFYEDLGAHSIYIPEYANRRFRFLQKLAQRSNCRLVITVNLGCLPRCPIRNYHPECISESGYGLDNGHFVDYSMMKCPLAGVDDPTRLIKVPWVRPEDMSIYEEMGITNFKIAGRERREDWLLRTITAYSEQRYDGYLNDIVNGFDRVKPAGNIPLRVSNRALDGYLSFFRKKECSMGCTDCNYCSLWASRVIETEGGQGEAKATGIEAAPNGPGYGAFQWPAPSRR